MHNALAYHLLTDAQLVPKQWSPSLPQPILPVFIVPHCVIWYRMSFGPVWVSCPGSVPSQLLVHPQVHTQGVWEHLSSTRGKASLLPCQLLNGSVGEGERVWEVVAVGVLLLHPSDKKMKPLVPSPSHPSCILFLPFLRA